MRRSLLTLLATTLLSTPSTSQSTESLQGGAIYTPADTSDPITSVSGTFKVPLSFVPSTGPTANQDGGIFGFSVYIGIGGYKGYGSSSSCAEGTSVLRAGIDVYYDGFSLEPMAPFAWYQFGGARDNGNFAYAGFNLEAGDLVRITVNAETGNTTAIIENFGQVESTAGRTPLQREPPTYGIGELTAAAMCRGEASWMVENHMTEEIPSSPKIMPNFTEVAFRELSVRTAKGAAASPVEVAKLVNIRLPEQGGQLTDCSVAGSDELRCARVVKP